MPQAVENIGESLMKNYILWPLFLEEQFCSLTSMLNKAFGILSLVEFRATSLQNTVKDFK